MQQTNMVSKSRAYAIMNNYLSLYEILTFRYAGINASDINFTAGRYDSTMKPPFDVGFEVHTQYIICCFYIALDVWVH